MKNEMTIQLSSAFTVNERPVDIDLKMLIGEINFLCGPNGAGKTSLLNFFKLNPQLFGGQKVAFLDQDRLSPLGGLSAEESIQIIREECGADPETFRPDLIKGLENKKISDLSGGENQLLKYTLSTASSFDFLFIDEPLLNLDAENKRRLISLFKELTEKKKTLLIVEHEPERYGELKGLINEVMLKGDRREVICGRV